MTNLRGVIIFYQRGTGWERNESRERAYLLRAVNGGLFPAEHRPRVAHFCGRPSVGGAADMGIATARHSTR
jgi:hypothetical protein